jgi:tetratricopeptide (TPR) repeat protein
MLRRLLPTLALTAVAWSSAQANLLDTWHEVQTSLDAGDAVAAEAAIARLQEEAVELDISRMPAFASALVTWAEANPGAEGEAMLRVAREMDPELPSAYFLAARWSAEKGTSMAAMKETVAGWIALLRFEPTRRVVGAWLLMWAAFSLAGAIVTFMVVVTIRFFRGMVFDARDLGGRIFKPANAWVFAFVLILLPLFAALGPVWLTVYLFILSWVYLGQALRIWAFLACLAMAFAVPTLAWVQHEFLHAETLASRVATTLDERQSDFGTLREFSDLAAELEDVSDFHLILGELLRMHGEPALAKVEFQKATLLAPENSLPLLFVANLALEEGNTKRSIQLFNQALELDGRNAFAYHNLSLAFDLSRSFSEGDAARARAREIAGREVAEDGLRGLEPRVRYPRLGDEDVDRLVGNLEPDQVALAVSGPSPLDPIKNLATPISLIFLAGAIVGLALLLFRLKFYPAAKECSKCGKVYRLEAGFGESTVYCSQCVSVFMKRDVVSIEQQTAKMDQIRRWEALTSLIRRLSGFLIPGGQDLLDGRVVRGFLWGFLAWFFVTGSLVWLPLFVPRIEPLATTGQMEVAFFVLVGLVVVRSGISAWSRR